MSGHMERYIHSSRCLSDPGPPPGRTRTHRYPTQTARAHLHTEPLLPRQSTIHSSRARALDSGCGSPGTPRGRSQHGPTHPTHAGEARARASTSSDRPRALLCTCIHTNGGPDERSDTAERAGFEAQGRRHTFLATFRAPICAPYECPDGQKQRRPPKTDGSVDGGLSAARSRAASARPRCNLDLSNIPDVRRCICDGARWVWGKVGIEAKVSQGLGGACPPTTARL